MSQPSRETFEKVRSGDLLLVGQIVRQEGSRSLINLIGILKDGLHLVDINIRVPMLACSLVYIKTAKAVISDGHIDGLDVSSFSFNNEKDISTAELHDLALKSFKFIAEAWPQEAAYVRSAIVDMYDVRLAMIWSENDPFSFVRNPPLLPPAGEKRYNFEFLDFRSCCWGRDLMHTLIEEGRIMEFPGCEGASIQVGDFHTVPVF